MQPYTQHQLLDTLFHAQNIGLVSAGLGIGSRGATWEENCGEQYVSGALLVPFSFFLFFFKHIQNTK